MRIFRKSDKDKPKTVLICYVGYFFVMGKPEHVDEMRNKLHKEFGIDKYGQLRKLLGV